MSASALVRAALHEGPSESAWRTLTQSLSAVPPEKLPPLRTLAERQASAWPPELRRAPPRLWAQPSPGLELVRSLRVGTPALAQLAWDHPRLRQLAHLHVELSSLGPEAEGFFDSPRLAGLVDLALGGPAPLGFELGHVWRTEFPRLRRLRMRDVDLGAVDVRLPARVTRALDELRLERVSGTGAAWDRLARVLRSEHPSVLGLDHLVAEEEHMVRLAASEVFARLIHLSLKGGASDRVLLALAYGLDVEGLLQLDLSASPCSDQGLTRFFTRGHFPATESLHLADLPTPVRLVGLHARTFPALRHLDLLGTRLLARSPWMDDPGLVARLESLGLDGEAAAPWASELRDGSMPSLRGLTIPRVEGPVLARLAGAAPRLQRLEAPGGAPSLAAWAAALHGPELRTVDLGASPGGDGLAELVGRKRLHRLRWQAPTLSRHGWAALAPMMTSLRSLDLGEAKMSGVDVEALAAEQPSRLHRLRWTGPDEGGASEALAASGALETVVELALGPVEGRVADRIVEAAPWLESAAVRLLDPADGPRLEAAHPLIEWRFDGEGGYHSQD